MRLNPEIVIPIFKIYFFFRFFLAQVAQGDGVVRVALEHLLEQPPGFLRVAAPQGQDAEVGQDLGVLGGELPRRLQVSAALIQLAQLHQADSQLVV